MYEVGQVLFLVATKTAKIVPTRVTAVTTTKTLEGEETSHSLEFADAPGQNANLEDLNVEIFKTGQELQKFMMTNATKAVNQQVKEAEEKVAGWGVPLAPPKKRRRRTKKKGSPSVEKSPSTPVQTSVGTNGAGEKLTVVLDDGVKANVILPENWT